MSIFSIDKSKRQDIYRLGISELIKREYPFISDVEFKANDLTINVDYYKTLWEGSPSEAHIRLDDDIIDSFQGLDSILFQASHYIMDQYVIFVTKKDHISLPHIMVNKQGGGTLHLIFRRDSQAININKGISVDIKGISTAIYGESADMEIEIQPQTVVNECGMTHNDPGEIYVHNIIYDYGGSVKFANYDYKYDLPEIYIDNIFNNNKGKFDTCWLEFLNTSELGIANKYRTGTSYAMTRHKIMEDMKNIHLPYRLHSCNPEINMKIYKLNKCSVNRKYSYAAEFEINDINTDYD